MKHYFRPTGNMLKLMDGRVFKKNQKNLWEDINSGVTINESQLQNFISSAAFSADPSGGGKQKSASPPPDEPPSNLFDTSLSDIVIQDNTSEVRTNTVIFNTSGGLVDIYAIFSAGQYNVDNCEFNTYVNGGIATTLQLDTRPPNGPGDVPGDPIQILACNNGDQVQFGVISPDALNLSFDVTIRDGAAGPVLDTFNVLATFSS